MAKLPTNLDPPTAEMRDLTMALIGLLPIGSVIALVAGKLWEDPRYASLRMFALSLAERLAALESVDVVDVLQRPETQPLLAQAFDAASRSIGEKKLEALRNATVQGVFERRYAFDMSAMVFVLLDRLTESHLSALRFVEQSTARRGYAATPSEIIMLGVDHRSEPSGMMKPMPSNFYEGKFYDQHLMDINTLVSEDLVNMGLVEEKFTVARDYDMNKAVKERRPDFIVLTTRGKLVCEHVFAPPDAGQRRRELGGIPHLPKGTD